MGGRSEFSWKDFMTWSEEAPRIMIQPHDRPATAACCPCVTWGFAVRPKRDCDPLTADTPEEEERRRKLWLDDINEFVGLFQRSMDGKPQEDNGPFRHRGDDGIVGAKITDELGDANFDADAAADNKLGLRSRNFRFNWRGVPGVIEVQNHTEFVAFLFILGFDLPRARLKTGDGVAPPELGAWAPEAMETQRALRDALDTILEDDGSSDEGAAVAEAAQVAFEDVWRDFADDIARAWRDVRKTPRPAKGQIRGRRMTGPPLMGEAFTAFRLVVAGPIAPREDPPVGGEAAAPLEQGEGRALDREDMAKFLYKRDAAIRRLFPESPDREFVAHGAERSRHIFVSTLSSALQYEIYRGDNEIKREPHRVYDADQTTPRGVIYFIRTPRGRGPNSHQIGRLIERLHSLEVFRAAALFDFRSLRFADRVLRQLGQKLDALTLSNIAFRRKIASDELWEVFKQLRNLDRDPKNPINDDDGRKTGGARGGLSFRVSRANLYVGTFGRRLEELKIQAIPTWQPLNEIMERRLRRSFDLIEEIGERRDRLLRRLTLLIEHLQWDELNEVQRDAGKTLQAADFIAAFSVIFGAGAVGATVGAVSDLATTTDYMRETIALRAATVLEAIPDAIDRHAVDPGAESGGPPKPEINPLGGALLGIAFGVLLTGVLGVRRVLQAFTRVPFVQQFVRRSRMALKNRFFTWAIETGPFALYWLAAITLIGAFFTPMSVFVAG